MTAAPVGDAEQGAVMLVGDWQTRCSVCRWGVDPSETHHVTVPPGYSNDAPANGCGALFTAMSPDFSARVMSGVKPCGHVADMRPDLPVTDLRPIS